MKTSAWTDEERAEMAKRQREDSKDAYEACPACFGSGLMTVKRAAVEDGPSAAGVLRPGSARPRNDSSVPQPVDDERTVATSSDAYAIVLGLRLVANEIALLRRALEERR